jgi:PEP-CTERM motif
MSKHVIVLLFLVLVLTVPAGAVTAPMPSVQSMDVTEIDNLAVHSSYNAATHQLTWSNGGVATLYYATGSAIFRVNVDATFDNMTDTSLNGLASAVFASGSFTVNFYALSDQSKTTSLGSTTGQFWPSWTYKESEILESPSKLYGSVPMELTSWTLSGYAWSGGLNTEGGLTATTTNINNNGNISDYQSNWSSSNTVVRVLADATGIPEPATMCLLGLGALGLIRRKRA